MNYIRWFHEISKSDTGLVGGKGSNLGELTRAGLPVPPGFCITSIAYQDFIHLSGLDRVIIDSLESIHLADLEDVKRGSAQIQTCILSSSILPEIMNEISVCYDELLHQNSQDIPLAVRSSATAEDQASASFAGQLETY